MARIDEGYGVSKRTGQRVRQQRSYYFHSKIEAERKLREELNRVEKGGTATVKSATVGAYLEQWLEGKQSVREGTARRYGQIVRLHLIPRLGHIRLARLTKLDVARALKALHDSGMAPTTIRQVRSVLKAALNSAIEDGTLARNVAKAAEAPRVDDPVPYTPTPEMARALVDACADPSLRRSVLFALGTGLRWGEQFGLRWSDVNLDDGFLRVGHSLTRAYAKGGYTLSDPKTPTSHRVVTLARSIVAVLRAEREAQLVAGPTDYVFTDAAGAVRPNDPRRFQTVLRQAGLLIRPDTGKPLTWHDLRAGSACLLLHTGAGLVEVSRRLGHSSVEITRRHYGGVSEGDRAALGLAFDTLAIA
jgi:integrase